jgi:hypothetical protein
MLEEMSLSVTNDLEREPSGESQVLIAIDPGCRESAWLVYDGGSIVQFGKQDNETVLAMLKGLHLFDHLAIEMVASYGMPVGKDVFETVLWIGRFVEAFDRDFTLVYRKDVKMHLCGSMKAKDANIRQALIDKIGPQGTKKEPGPTYGISKDVWSALAIAVTHTAQVGRG